MGTLAGNARIIIEGDFKLSDLDGIESLAVANPTVDFFRESRGSKTIVVFPLTQETILPLSRCLCHERDLREKFVAIQIVKNGEVQFLAGDNFHPECVSVGSDISSAVLTEWTQLGIISGILPVRGR
jgi:hypothetical protein